jgi:hypothetical protein
MLIHSFGEVKLLASILWRPSKGDLRLSIGTLAKAGFSYVTAGRVETVSDDSGMAAYRYRYHVGSARIAGLEQRTSATAAWSHLVTRRLDSRLWVDRLYHGGNLWKG